MPIQPIRDWLRLLIGHGAHPVAAAIFGKHPAWDDHAELIGATPEVVRLHADFYAAALSRAIDRAPPAASPRYAHDLLWIGPKSTVAARLSPSSDGKGRSLYPLVTCLAVDSPPAAAWLQGFALPACRALADRIAAAETRAEVAAALESINATPPRNDRPPVPALPEEIASPSARDRGSTAAISLTDHPQHTLASLAQALANTLPKPARALLSQQDDAPIVRIAFSPIIPEHAGELLAPDDR